MTSQGTSQSGRREKAPRTSKPSEAAPGSRASLPFVNLTDQVASQRPTDSEAPPEERGLDSDKESAAHSRAPGVGASASPSRGGGDTPARAVDSDSSNQLPLMQKLQRASAGTLDLGQSETKT